MDNDSHGDADEQDAPPPAGRDAPGAPGDQPQQRTGEQRDANKQRDGNRKYLVFGLPLFEFLQFVFDLALVAAGIVGAVVIIRQLRIMERQLNDAENDGLRQQVNTRVTLRLASEQAKASTNAATEMGKAAAENKRSADAAVAAAKQSERIAKASESSVRTTQDAMRLDQRAWVGIEEVSGNPTLGQQLRVVVKYRNTGKTPALHLYAYMTLDHLIKGDRPVFTYPPGPFMYDGIVPPNAGHKTTIIAQLKDSTIKPLLEKITIDEISNGDKAIFVHGRIVYEDIFKRCRWLTFCTVYDPEVNSYGACREHNDTGDGGTPPCRRD